MTKRNTVGWFEIPVTDMERAIAFYSKVFDIKIERATVGTLEMAWFPGDPDNAGATGSLVKQDEFYKPSQNGVLIYFTSHSGDLSNELNRVEAAGGKITVPKKLITEDIGYMAVFIDTEGNRVAIHSLK